MKEVPVEGARRQDFAFSISKASSRRKVRVKSHSKARSNSSGRLSLAAGAFAWMMLLGLVAYDLPAATVQLLSVPHATWDSAVGSSFSEGSEVSADGRYVVFVSQASNLTRIPPASGHIGAYLNVYVREVSSHRIELVSVNGVGERGGRGHSAAATISADGRYIAFHSEADDLVENDTNSVSDIFVRDTNTGVTILVSLNYSGSSSGNQASMDPVITPDGQFVAFTSLASDLTPDDTNQIQDVFVRDLRAGKTSMASTGAFDASPPLTRSELPSISSDGKKIAFVSSALFPALGLDQSVSRILIRDLAVDSLSYISENAIRTAASTLISNQPLVPAFGQELSPDARRLAFKTPGTNDNAWLLLLYNLENETAAVISTNTYGIEVNQPDPHPPSFSGDSTKLLYTELVNNVPQLLLLDIPSGEKSLISLNTNGTPANAGCEVAGLSRDGQHVVFVSAATDLVEGITNGTCQVYCRDQQTQITKLVSADPNGKPALSVDSTWPTISEDGKVIAFEAFDSSFVAGDNNGAVDVFLKDLHQGSVILISSREPTLKPTTPNNFTTAPPGGFSVSGDRVILTSYADNMTVEDSNGHQDVFMVQLQPYQIRLGAANTNDAVPNAGSYSPQIDGTGHALVFFSTATDATLIADTNQLEDLFWRDLSTSKTELVTRGFDDFDSTVGDVPNPTGLYPTEAATLSRDGRTVAFVSGAWGRIQPGNSPGAGGRVLRRDMTTGQTIQIDTNYVSWPLLSPDGQQIIYWTGTPGRVRLMFWDATTQVGRPIKEWTQFLRQQSRPVSDQAWTRIIFEFFVGSSRRVYSLRLTDGLMTSVTDLADASAGTNRFSARSTLSANGRFVVFISQESRYDERDRNQTQDVFRRDLETGELLLVSINALGNASGLGTSSNPSISADGRFVAFDSEASDLVCDDQNGTADIFLRDMMDNRTILISRSSSGHPANGISMHPLINLTGDKIVFSSLASDLVPGDYNDCLDVFVVDLSAPRLGPARLESGNLILTFGTQSGRHYRIEAADELSRKQWTTIQELEATSHLISARIPLKPTSPQRYYRIVLAP